MNNSIYSITSKDNQTLGTGFVIDNDDEGSYLATCGHVVNKCGSSVIVNGVESSVISNGYSDGIDIAIIYVKGLNQKPLPVMPSKTAKKVKVIGYTKLQQFPKRECIDNIPLKMDVSIEKSESLNIASMKLTPPESISSGYSGSPVICEEQNVVIGIVNIQLGRDTNYAICVSHLLNVYPSIKGVSASTPIVIYEKKKITSQLTGDERAVINHVVEQDLESALQSFSTQMPVWVEPQLYLEDENESEKSQNGKVDLSEILKNPRNIEIFSRQQYGSTCLAYYLVKEAWKAETPSIWFYIDIKELKPKNIRNFVTKKLKKLKLSHEDVECIVLDELTNNIQNADIILRELFLLFINIPIIVMRKITDNTFLHKHKEFDFERKFERIFLWALPRHVIRTLVNQYNEQNFIENENKVVNKIITDLEVINIPRTPQNCLTLLKIFETNFDHSPINRAEMIHRILSLLFNFDHIPSYKRRPDLKDTEHILGYFCGSMIKDKSYYFTQKFFMDKLGDYCKTNEIDIDVDVIFDVFCNNNILIEQEQQFHFKFSFWIFYFSAHRMLHNSEFRDFVLKDCNYLSYPEIIEFYSGIDRQRNDLLKVLINDLSNIKTTVINKCGLPKDFNIFDYAKWLPSKESISEMTTQISTGIINSNLPDEIKDNFADFGYNRVKPLKQGVGHILEEYSVLRLMKCITSCSKALRNSSFSDVKLKHEILNEIICSWNELSKVLISIAPLLTEHGVATVEGASFKLLGDFGDSKEEIFRNIIQLVPSNINKWFSDDIFSDKLSSMFINRAKTEKNFLNKHILNLIIIHKRPNGWEQYIDSYIQNEDKNSFYLMDILESLKGEYQYSFSSNKSLNSMKVLIKKSLAKHVYGNEKKIGRVKDSNIPHRNEKEL